MTAQFVIEIYLGFICWS